MDHARELKKLWNRKMTVIKIVVSALSMIFKGLEKEQEDMEISRQKNNAQITALLRSARILIRILKT